MKNILIMLAMAALLMACNPTRNELKTARRAEKKSAYARIEKEQAVKSELYASTNKFVIINRNFYDSLQKRADQSPSEIFRKIEKDKAASFQNLKKSMTTKVYSTALAVDGKESSTVKEDTVYTVKGGGWYAVE